jgi:hypothetical protein
MFDEMLDFVRLDVVTTAEELTDTVEFDRSIWVEFTVLTVVGE